MKRAVQHFSSYPTVITTDKDGRFDVSFPDFPGCVTFGNTFEEALEKAGEVLSLWIEELEADKKPIPSGGERAFITEVKVATPNSDAVAHG